MIGGINHITLSIKDVETSFHFYTTILGFKPVARWPKGAYLLAGDVWIALVLDEQTRAGPLPEYTHVAFGVSEADFEQSSARIVAAGTQIWQDNWSEGDSLYFLDPDGHKLEIHATDLEARIASAKAAPWEGLEFFV